MRHPSPDSIASRLARQFAAGLALVFAGLVSCGRPETLTCVEDLETALLDPTRIGHTFDLSGEVLEYYRGKSNEWNILIRSGSDFVFLKDMSATLSANATTGLENYSYLDCVRFRGRIFLGTYPEGCQFLGFLQADRLSAGQADRIPDIALGELANPTNLNRLVRLRGTVRAAARDESDPNFAHLLLKDDDGAAHVSIHFTAATPFDPECYLGAQVRASGICRNLSNYSLRRHIGHILSVSGLENVEFSSPPANLRNAPELSSLTNATPQQIASIGLVRERGIVLAAWSGNSVLLKASDDRLVQMNLQSSNLPSFGEQIVVLGLPVTDFYSINLIHAHWQPSGLPRQPPAPAMEATSSSLLMQYKGKLQLMVRQQGRALRFAGVIRYLPPPDAQEKVLQLESDGSLIPIDVTANRQILDMVKLGSRISVAGTCIVNVDNWNVETVQDVNQRFFLVPRTPDDVTVLSHPPWWTSGRLLSLLGFLAAALLGIIGWNVSLNRRAKAKARELAEEQLAHVTSELKVNERTRLAIELHDMLSQMLSGISMQIGVVRKFFDMNRSKALDHLGIADKTLLACRESLRDCLWDLRHHAIEEPDMGKAIHDTLEPHVDGVTLAVRFAVPRDLLTDNAAHAILSIIRELVVNAIRHGSAKSVKVAGSVENGTVFFSVSDNGSGFDPASAPGMPQGHFGLQGIRERVEGFEGEMTVISAIGKGTKVTVALHLPKDTSRTTNE